MDKVVGKRNNSIENSVFVINLIIYSRNSDIFIQNKIINIFTNI